MADDKAGRVSFESSLHEKRVRAHDGLQGFDAAGIVRRIREGEAEAVQELHRIFDRGVRFLIARKLGPNETETVFAETFREIERAVSRGEVSDSDNLAAHVHAAVQRSVDAWLAKKHSSHTFGSEGAPCPAPTDAPRRACDNIEPVNFNSEAIACTKESTGGFETAGDYEKAESERRRSMLSFLASLPARDREALIRFYVHQQPAERICREMGLAEGELSILRSSARIGFIGTRKEPVASRPLGTLGRISVGRIVRPQKRSTA